MQSSPKPLLSLSFWTQLRLDRSAIVLCSIAALTFFVTGSGTLEGQAVYPSWRTLAALDGLLIVTAVLALPIQAELATPRHSPEEIIALVDRLISVGYLREIPGLAVAAGFIGMLVLAIRGRTR